MAGLATLLAWPALVGLAGTLRLAAGLGTVAVVYKDRLVIGQGSRFEDVLWDDVEAVYVRTHAGGPDDSLLFSPGERFTLWVKTEVPLARFWAEWTEVRTRDGRTVRIPSTITGYEDLSGTVQGEVSYRLWPKALAEHRAGRPVAFGPLGVEPNGLRVGNDRLGWEAHQWTWDEGGLVVTGDTSAARVGPAVRTEEVPNLAVALYLISRVTQELSEPR